MPAPAAPAMPAIDDPMAPAAAEPPPAAPAIDDPMAPAARNRRLRLSRPHRQRLAPAATPAAKPIDDDPFSSNQIRSLRLWTDASGKYQVEAALVSFDDGTVRLQKANGHYVRVSLDKLCLLDQQFVSSHQAIATAW